MGRRKFLLLISFFVLVFFFISYSLQKFVNLNPNLRLGEPEMGTYRSDEFIFLKTFYLLEKGHGYYSSFREAVEGDARGIVLTNDAFAWRLPTVFYFWQLTAKDGIAILRNFWILVTLSLVAVYFLLRKFTNKKIAILGSIILIPYFVDTVYYKTSYLFTEWWAWFFMIFGLCFFVYDKKKLAFPLFILAVFSRELMMIPFLIFLIYSLFLRKNRLFFASVVVAFIALFLIHQTAVSSQFGKTEYVTNLSSAVLRLHNFDRLSFLEMISFSMRQYPLVAYKSHYLLVLFGMISLGLNLVRRSKNKEIFLIFLAAWSLFLILPFITTSQYNDYWGILFMPTLLLSIPFLIRTG